MYTSLLETKLWYTAYGIDVLLPAGYLPISLRTQSIDTRIFRVQTGFHTKLSVADQSSPSNVCFNL